MTLIRSQPAAAVTAGDSWGWSARSSRLWAERCRSRAGCCSGRSSAVKAPARSTARCPAPATASAGRRSHLAPLTAIRARVPYTAASAARSSSF